MPPKGLFRDFGLRISCPEVGDAAAFGNDFDTFGDSVMREGRLFSSCDIEREVIHTCGDRRGADGEKMELNSQKGQTSEGRRSIVMVCVNSEESRGRLDLT